MADDSHSAVREVSIVNPQGMHARPIMKFVDHACQYASSIIVTNLSKGREPLDGKSAMHLMLLEGVQGSVLRIEAEGDDAERAVEDLAALVSRSFDMA